MTPLCIFLTQFHALDYCVERNFRPAGTPWWKILHVKDWKASSPWSYLPIREALQEAIKLQYNCQLWKIHAIHAKSQVILRKKKAILLSILDLFVHVKGVIANAVFLPLFFCLQWCLLPTLHWTYLLHVMELPLYIIWVMLVSTNFSVRTDSVST